MSLSGNHPAQGVAPSAPHPAGARPTLGPPCRVADTARPARSAWY